MSHKSVSKKGALFTALLLVGISSASFGASGNVDQASASSSPIVTDPGCKANTLERNDDDSAYVTATGGGGDAEDFDFAVEWYGETYTSFAVNNNGGIKWDADAWSDFSGLNLADDTNDPLIAVGFADLDTRNTNTDEVTFGPLQETVFGYGGYCINWVDIGDYNSKPISKSFQLLILDVSEENDDVLIVMNYDRMDAGSRSVITGWAADGGRGYIFAGDLPASGTQDQLGTEAGSLVAKSFVPTDSGLAVTPGRYVFEIEGGGPTEAPGSPEPPTSLNATAGNGEISLTFTASSTASVTNYAFQVRPAGGSWQNVTTADIARDNDTSTTVVLGGLTGGQEYTVRSSAFKSVSSAASTPSNAVTPTTAPTNLSVPTISGSPTAGQTLTVADGSWRDGGATVTSTTYQWISTLSGDTSNIDGATESSLCIPEALVGATLKVEVTKTNGVGSVSEESESTVAVAEGTACPVQETGQTENSDDDRDEDDDDTPAPVVAPTTGGTPVAIPPRAATPPQANLPVTRQGPVLRNGVAPREVRTPEVRVGGVATAVESSVTNPSTLSVRAGTLSLGVQVAEDQGGVSQAADGTIEIGVSKGGSTNLSGSGLRPGSTVQVFLPLQGSNAKELTRIPVGEDGSFNGDASFATEPEDEPLPIGRQVMQMVSVDVDGNEVVVDMTVNVAQSEPTPELNRVDGVIPTMAPGASIATNAGVPEEVTVTAVEEQKLAVVEGDGWSMAVEVGAEDGGVDGSAGGASITLVRDESAQVSGEGFMPGTRADVWLFSEPTLLGTVTIDDEGRFNGEMNIDGAVVSAGEHTLQMQGVGVDGYVRSANMGVVVDDSNVAAAEETAQASMAVIWWSLAGVIVLAAVVGLTIARRRHLF